MRQTGNDLPPTVNGQSPGALGLVWGSPFWFFFFKFSVSPIADVLVAAIKFQPPREASFHNQNA